MAPSEVGVLGTVVGLGMTLALSMMSARQAVACSTAECALGYFVPGDGATVPANLPVLYWAPMNGAGAKTEVTLTTAAAPGTPLAFTITRLDNGHHVLRPTAGLIEGTTYVLTDNTTCATNPAQPGPRATFTVGLPAPLPGPIGSLTARAEERRTIDLATRGGSCSSDAEVSSAAITLELTPEAWPWRDVFHHQTFVDGQPWSPRASLFDSVAPGASWRGRGEDLVYTICASEDPSLSGLGAGLHEVTMRTSIPGFASGFVASSTIVDLDCDPPAGGCSSSSSGAGPWLILALCASRCRRRRRAPS